MEPVAAQCRQPQSAEPVGVPAVGRTRVAGLPVTLIVLGFAFYPVFLAVGWFYHRQARQLEARFTDLVDPAGHRPDD